MHVLIIPPSITKVKCCVAISFVLLLAVTVLTFVCYPDIYSLEYSKLGRVEKVVVNIIPNDQVETFKRKSFLDTNNDGKTRETMELSLTPPLVAVWTYQLAFALSQGCLKLN